MPSTNQKPTVTFKRLMINGIIIDPGNVLSLDIYESIDFPGITGNLKFKDFGVLMDGYDIFAGDPVEIEFESPGSAPLITKNLVITESKGSVILADSPANAISLGFASEWMVNGMTMNISKEFKNKRIDEIVKDLVEFSGQPFGESNSVEQGGTFIKTKQTLENFMTPYWSPLKIIKYLMSLATDEGGFGGYVLFTELNTGRVNFMPIGMILSGDYRETDMTLRQNTHFELSKNRIFNQSIENGFDIVKYASQGLATSNYIGFDFDKTEEINIDKKIVDSYPESTKFEGSQPIKEGYITEGLVKENIQVKHLGRDTTGGVFPLNMKYLGDKFKNTKFSTFYGNTNDLIKTDNDLLVESRLNTKFSLMSADAIKINASTIGETEYKRAGTIINLMVPNSDKGKTGDSEQLSGRYLITKVRHSYTKGQYINTITLVSDAIKSMSTNRQDIIRWNGRNYYQSDEELTVDVPKSDIIVDRRRRLGVSQ